MYLVYVLRNLTSGRHYTGHTADVTQRIGQHNHGITRSTKNRGLWEMLYQEEFASRSEAIKAGKVFEVRHRPRRIETNFRTKRL